MSRVTPLKVSHTPQNLRQRILDNYLPYFIQKELRWKIIKDSNFKSKRLTTHWRDTKVLSKKFRQAFLFKSFLVHQCEKKIVRSRLESVWHCP